MTKYKKFIKPGLLLLFVIIGLYIGKYTGAQQYFDRSYIENYISTLGLYGPIVFMLLYFIGSLFFFPATPLTILSGILFGPFLGTTYTVIGATLGASAAFFLSRFLGKDFADKIIKDKFKGIDKYDEKLREKGLITTLFLRVVPIFPFNGLNFALGLTRIKFRDFFMGTAIGIIPGSFILANIGSASAELSSPVFYAFIGLFLMLALLPGIYKKYSKNTI